MIRQFFRLILFILVFIKDLIFKHPGILGFMIGSILGFIIGLFMVKYGFPLIALPINTLVWGIGIAPVVKEYLDRLTK
jgi:hypothetical protein